MERKHMNLFFPQWQGSGKTDELLIGAMEIKEKYLKGDDFREIKVDRGENKTIENNILGYSILLRQLQEAKEAVSAENPERIFLVGGGCDAEIPIVSYLNRRLGGDLTVSTWIFWTGTTSHMSWCRPRPD